MNKTLRTFYLSFFFLIKDAKTNQFEYDESQLNSLTDKFKCEKKEEFYNKLKTMQYADGYQ